MAREANDQLVTSKEQLATLKKQLEETQRLIDQAERPRLKLRKPKPKLRGREMKQNSMVMTSTWLRSRMPYGQRSPSYVVLTALRLGKKPSIELGLMLLPS